MGNTASQERSTHPGRETRKQPDGYAAIAALAGQGLTSESFVRHAFRAVATHFRAMYASVRTRSGAISIEDELRSGSGNVTSWRAQSEAVLLKCQLENCSIVRVYGDRHSSRKIAAMGAPLPGLSGEPNGALVVIAMCRDNALAERMRSELHALCMLIASLIPTVGRDHERASDRSISTREAVARAADYHSLTQLAFAITNNLCNKMGCDQVIFGIVRRHRARVLSVSGMDDIKPRSPGIHHVRQAMDECIDHGAPIVVQNDDSWNDRTLSRGHRLHRQWHQASGNASVVSIPLMVEDRCVGVVSLRRRNERPFVHDEIEKLRSMVEPFAGAIGLVQKASRSLATHAVDAVADTACWMVRPAGVGRKLLIVLAMTCVAWIAFGRMTYSVAVPSVVVAARVSHISAPFQGAIASAPIKPGDYVRSGDTIVELRTDEWELERRGLDAEIAATRIMIDQAVAADDVRTAVLKDAEMAVLEARRQAIERKIRDARVTAPADGRVLRGDLERRIGEVVPLGEPLFEFAFDESTEIELLIPEHRAADMVEGLNGRFSGNGRPGDRRDFTIARVSPTSEMRDGVRVFVAVAEMESVPEWLRPGMEGAARVDVGDRPVWWVMFHGAIDAVRMRLWF